MPRVSLFLLPCSVSMIKARLPEGPHVFGGAWMGMDEHSAMLGVQVAVGPDADADEIAQVTLLLRRELLDLDVDALGALVVHVADSQVLAAVVAAVRSWLAGSSRRSIKLELGGDALELTGVSSREQRRLADEWLARHGR